MQPRPGKRTVDPERQRFRCHPTKCPHIPNRPQGTGKRNFRPLRERMSGAYISKPYSFRIFNSQLYAKTWRYRPALGYRIFTPPQPQPRRPVGQACKTPLAQSDNWQKSALHDRGCDRLVYSRLCRTARPATQSDPNSQRPLVR